MVIEIENLKFSWPLQKRDFLNIESFAVKPGEMVFFYGPSGSGKSTFLNLMAGVLPVNSGSIRITGDDLSKLSTSERDKFRGNHLGYIFQQFNLVPYLSPLENIIIVESFSKEKIRRLKDQGISAKEEATRLLKSLGLDDDELINRPSSSLSVGQQQRVAAARALFGFPEVIIADEPTSALDRDTQEQFLKLLFSECRSRKIALVFVSHDRNLGKLFDREVSLIEINSANTGVKK